MGSILGNLRVAKQLRNPEKKLTPGCKLFTDVASDLEPEDAVASAREKEIGETRYAFILDRKSTRLNSSH